MSVVTMRKLLESECIMDIKPEDGIPQRSNIYAAKTELYHNLKILLRV